MTHHRSCDAHALREAQQGHRSVGLAVRAHPLQHVVARLLDGALVGFELLVQRVPLVADSVCSNVGAGRVRGELAANRLRCTHGGVGEALLRKVRRQGQQVVLLGAVAVQHEHQVGARAFVLGAGVFDDVFVFAHAPILARTPPQTCTAGSAASLTLTSCVALQ